jgi:mutator family transposase
MRNALATVPKVAQQMVAATLRTIFAQPDLTTAQEAVERISRLFEKRYPQLFLQGPLLSGDAGLLGPEPEQLLHALVSGSYPPVRRSRRSVHSVKWNRGAPAELEIGRWWAVRESNSRPPRCKRAAARLASCTARLGRRDRVAPTSTQLEFPRQVQVGPGERPFTE